MEIVILIAAAVAVCLRRHAAAGQSLAGLCRPPHPPQREQKIKAAARCGSLCFVPLMEVKV